MKIIQKDKKYIARGSAPKDIVITQSHKEYLYDSTGKKYIDFVMGWCVGNIGWDNAVVRKSIKDFSGPDYVLPSYIYRPWVELAELLAEMTPGKLQKSFFATGGTEAVEIALQAAMSHTGRKHFISVEGSYHGHSIGAMSVGENDFRKHYKNLLFHCNKIKPPLDDRVADKVIKLLKNRTIAALIMEPIIMNLGVEIPEKKFMQRIAVACKKYGTVLIMDEVASGFGRTGKMFATEHYGIKPDVMTMAKGLSGGYGAIGATVVTPAVAKSMEWGFSHYSTYGWHPLNVAATLANLKYLKQQKNKLLAHANAMGEYIQRSLLLMPFKYEAEDIRQVGLAISVQFSKSEYPGKIVDRCRKHGLLIAKGNRTNSFNMFPPLTVRKSVIIKAMDILAQQL